MARMSIDDQIMRDPRIDRLAQLCGWSRRETRACMEDVWALCYDRAVPYLPSEDIETTAVRDAVSPPKHEAGFVVALQMSGLGRPAKADDRFYTKKDGTRLSWKDGQWRDRVYLAGASERIGYLLTSEESGRRGGLKSGESRRYSAKAPLGDPSTHPQGCTNPSAPVPVPVSSPAQLDLASRGPDSPGLRALKDKCDAASPDGFKETVAVYFSRFEAAYGHKPTWGSKHGAQIKPLLKSHGAEEVQRRIGILFESPPEWLKGPFDLGTLVANFDRLVVASTREAQPQQLRRLKELP